MKPAFESITRQLSVRTIVVLFVAIMLVSSSSSLFAQSPQLTLADLLIGLRSKKVSLEERNVILSGAVASRGVTFSLTPEIERELLSTGAKMTLLDTIRKKAPIVKVSTVSNPDPKPVTPPPPDFSFFEKRAATEATAGNAVAAIADYSKAIELNSGAISSYLGRGAAHFGKGSFDLAINDFNKVLETLPKNTIALSGRAASFEAAGKLELAKVDLSKVLELEPENQAAKNNLSRVQIELDKIAEAQKPKPEPPVAQPKPVKPDFVDVGAFTEANAIRMVKPVYSVMASRSNIGGKVTVELVVDENGKVISAKAISGHTMLRSESENAAMRSQFKPQMWNGQPIAAKGVITYNFVSQR
jgi:TonB family protein